MPMPGMLEGSSDQAQDSGRIERCDAAEHFLQGGTKTTGIHFRASLEVRVEVPVLRENFGVTIDEAESHRLVAVDVGDVHSAVEIEGRVRSPEARARNPDWTVC